MNTTNGLQVTIKNGTLFLNDDITIEFLEATMNLPNKVEHIKLDKTTTVKEVAVVKKVVKKATPKKAEVKKIETGNFGDRKIIIDNSNKETETLMNLIKEKGPITTAKLKLLTNYTQHRIKNFCFIHKQKGLIVCTDRATYDIPDRKGTSSKQKSPDILSEYVDADGTCLEKNCAVKLLNFNAVKEDDNIDFPTEFSGIKAFVTGWDDGSSMIKIKVATGQNLLVYPHWLRKTLNTKGITQ
jgi:predicted transcriptional regulator